MTRREEFEELSVVFKALSHPIRLEIVHFLINNGGAFVQEIVDELQVSQAQISQCLAKLKVYHIVMDTRMGTRIKYKVCHPIVLKYFERIAL